MGGADFHKNSLLVQEFIPGNDFDARITITGKRAFGARRYSRPHDFRASGCGNITPEPSLIDLEAVRLGFQVAETLGAQTICIHVLRRGDTLVACAVSYYVDGWVVHKCPGCWELTGSPGTGRLEWAAGQVRVEYAILEGFLARLAGASSPVLQPVA